MFKIFIKKVITNMNRTKTCLTTDNNLQKANELNYFFSLGLKNTIFLLSVTL